MRVGFWRLDPWHNKGQSQEKFLDCTNGTTSISDEQVSASTQKQALHQQASARERTLATRQTQQSAAGLGRPDHVETICHL